MANHSCSPSCTQSFQGSRMSFRALRAIEAGEEISIAYIEVAACYPERRASLLNEYCFDLGPLQEADEVSHLETSTSHIKIYKDINAAGCDADKDGKLSKLLVSGRDPGCGVCVIENGKGKRAVSIPFTADFSSEEVSSPRASPAEISKREIRIWGFTAEDCKQVGEGLEEALNLWEKSQSAVAAQDFLGANSTLRGVQTCFDEICNLSSGEVVSLGLSHVFRLRLLESQLRCSIEAEDWEGALDAAQKLEQPYCAAYPEVWPAIAIHYATMAKLWMLEEESERAADYAKLAIRMLQVTHGDSSFVVKQAERTLWEAMQGPCG